MFEQSQALSSQTRGAMKSMKIKLLVRLAILFISLFVSVLLTVAVSIRKDNREAAMEKGLSIADLTRNAITSLMAIGAADKQDLFLRGMVNVYGLSGIRIVRGSSVVKQYGPSESGKPITPMDMEVLRTGEKMDSLTETFSNVTYSLTIPYKASPTDTVDCLSCHKDKYGSVLGAINITMDLTKDRFSGMGALVIIGGISVVFFVIGFFMVIRFFNPYILTADRLKRALEKAKDGRFDDRVEVITNDEMGAVTTSYNTMAVRLSDTLSEMDKKVSILIGRGEEKSGNALRDTALIVDELARIYNFKRVIEKDKGKVEIYTRLASVFSEYLGIERFSLYEVNRTDNTMSLVSVTEVAGWCADIILERADECRTYRTSRDVDSREFPCICPNFAPCVSGSSGDLVHYCLPVYVGGAVGMVVQFVFPKEDSSRVKELVFYIKCYLREISPVLEANTFMEVLKEKALVDQLTGLRNRRYLEEISVGLVSQTLRRGTLLGVLMVDVDHFKEVNDTHGHEVGDIVLREMAAAVRTSVRESDIVVRFGGEELLILLIDVDKDMCMKVAEKVRQGVQQKIIEFPGGRLKKTVSVGVAEFPADADKLWQTIKYSDVALYRAKELGRNRVVRFEKEMWKDEEY